jgi:hypothetical protein
MEIKKKISQMGILLFGIFLFLQLSIQAAFANNPPGPQQFSAVILIIFVMNILTFLGCPPKLRKEIKGSRLLNMVIIFILIILAACHEGMAAIVTLIFAVYAVFRSFIIIRWGIKARFAEKPEYLNDISPWRLIISGVSLVLLTVFLVNGSIIFFLDRSYYLNRTTQTRLKDFVTFQMAYCRAEKMKTGSNRFFHNNLTENEEEKKSALKFFYNTKIKEFEKLPFVNIKYGKDDSTFTIHVLPVKKYPFPYNYFILLPTYYADQTGNIRGMVTQNYIECPPVAPVIMKIEENEIVEMQKKIRD